MPLIISERLVVPDTDLTFSAIRSPGPGGQNVNKVATAVQLRFDLANSQALAGPVKQRIRARAGHRLNDDGTLLFVARAHRSQERNRADALERLRQLIVASLEPPRPFEGVGAVALLRAMGPLLDRALQCLAVRKVEPQLHGGGHLVHILAPRAG